MGFLDSLLGTVAGGKGEGAAADASPIVGVLGDMLNKAGGLQGLMQAFQGKGLGDVFSSWVGLGENQSISADQLQGVLGSEQVAHLASKLGVPPEQAGSMLSEYLPKIIDKLTPSGEVDPNADHQSGLAEMLPGLLQTGLGKLLGGQGA